MIILIVDGAPAERETLAVLLLFDTALLSLTIAVLPHFPWSRFMFELQEAIHRSRPARFTPQITESADEPQSRAGQSLGMLYSFARITIIPPAYPFTARKLGLLWHGVHIQQPWKNVWPFWNALAPGNPIL
jgi:hypothetical protein